MSIENDLSIVQCVQIARLLGQLDEAGPAALDEALEWCFWNIRQQGGDLAWNRRPGVVPLFTKVGQISQLMGCSRGHAAAALRAALLPSKASITLETLRRYVRERNIGGVAPRRTAR